MQAALYLIPVTLGDTDPDRVLPTYNREIIAGIRHFAVENIRSARRFLRRSNRDIDIDSLTFYTLDEHTRPEEIAAFLAPLRAGEPMGIISEAGCPAIADPGADLVAIAQREGLPVVPTRRTIIDIVVSDGQRVQRTKFCLHRLLACRWRRAGTKDTTNRTTRLTKRTKLKFS